MLDERIKSTGFVIGALTFIAYIKQYIYYCYFNVDISSYISIEEVFTPFIDELAINGSTVFITYFVLPTVLKNIPILTKSTTNEVAIKTTNWMQNLVYYTTVFASVIFALTIFISFWFTNKELIIMRLILSGILILFVYFLLAIFSDFKTFFADFYETSVLITLLIIIVTAYNCIWLGFELWDKKYQYLKINYRFIKSDDMEIFTDSNTVYLGRTKSNFFILKSNTKQVDVYNTSDIIKESIIVR
ncbi:MAG: hypothetical protein JWM14_1566 [Chitinophagaceae bacterium]|nr:hypothetical protein [Chitinophagaceae bacterium]